METQSDPRSGGMAQSANLLEAAIDALDSRIAILDRRGVIVCVNSAWRCFAEMHGAEARGAGVGDNYLNALERSASNNGAASSEARRAADGIGKVVTGALSTFTWEYPWPAGSQRRWFLMRATRFDAGGDAHVIVVHDDVTERRQAELAAREGETRFRELADSAPVLMWTSGPDKQGLFFNKTWLDFTGQSLESQLGDGWLEFVHPDDRDALMEACLKAFTDRRTFTTEFRLRRADGQYRWMLDAGAPQFSGDRFLGFVGSCVDITDARIAQQRVIESERRLELALRAGRMGAWEWNIDTGAVSWSPALEEIHGLEPGTFGGTFDEFLSDIHPDERDRVVETIQRTLREREPYHVEYRIIRPDGAVVWLEARGEVVADDGGPHRRMVGVCADVTDRKQVDQALHESNERYRAIVEGQSEMLCRFRLDGTILFANTAYAQAFQSTPEEMVGRSFWNVIDEADHELVRSQLARITPDNPQVSIENRVETAEGTRWTLWTNRGLVFDHNGRVVEAQSSGIDITERKKGDEAQAHLAAIVSCSEDAIISKSMEGRVTSWNRGAERLFGYSAEEAIGQSIIMLVPDDRLDEEHDILTRLRRGERIRHFETTRQTKDGRRIDVSLSVSPVRDAHGEITGASSVARDITAQKNSERALRESEQRLRAVIDTAVDGVITIDERGIVKSFNPAAVRIFGYVPDEVIGRNVSMLMPAPYRAEHDSYIANYLHTGQRRIIGSGREVRGRRKDGSTFPMELAVSETKLDGDRRIFIGLVRDITERKRHERMMKLVMQELNHRVKNTLAIAAATADQTMRHSTTLQQFREAYTERLQSMAKVHRLLTRTEWEGAELNDLLRTELDHRAADPQQIQLEGPLVLLDPNSALAMHMVVHELSTNAVKYGALSRSQGCVDVRWTRETDQTGTSWVALRWIESGGPPVETQTRRGFGTRVIRRTVQHELDGETEIRFEPAGLQCFIRFPWPSESGTSAGHESVRHD